MGVLIISKAVRHLPLGDKNHRGLTSIQTIGITGTDITENDWLLVRHFGHKLSGYDLALCTIHSNINKQYGPAIHIPQLLLVVASLC